MCPHPAPNGMGQGSLIAIFFFRVVSCGTWRACCAGRTPASWDTDSGSRRWRNRGRTGTVAGHSGRAGSGRTGMLSKGKGRTILLFVRYPRSLTQTWKSNLDGNATGTLVSKTKTHKCPRLVLVLSLRHKLRGTRRSRRSVVFV